LSVICRNMHFLTLDQHIITKFLPQMPSYTHQKFHWGLTLGSWERGRSLSGEGAWPGSSITMGQGRHVPNIYEGGTSMVMSPPIGQYTVVCCIFNVNIMCCFTKKASDPSLLLCPPNNNPVRSTPLGVALFSTPLELPLLWRAATVGLACNQ